MQYTFQKLIVDGSKLLEHLDLRLLSTPDFIGLSIPFTKHSPFVPVFSQGFQRLKQSGVFDLILLKWIGVLPKSVSVSTHVLGTREMIPIFASYTSCAFVAVFAFFFELTIMWLLSNCCKPKSWDKCCTFY